MEKNEIILLLYSLVACVLIGQIEASGNIGNRSYSLWYETHFLIEKKGICKLIYFKPRHFDRYTLYEVMAFFGSYLAILVTGILAILCLIDVINEQFLLILAGSVSGLGLISMLAIAVINDIGARKDQKKKFYLESGERENVFQMPKEMLSGVGKHAAAIIQIYANNRNNAYFTIYNLWDSYDVRLKQAKNDAQKKNRVQLDYIQYFRNIDRLVVIKENKDGSLQLKIKEEECV